MKDYIKRLFSWKGEASRKEMIGFLLLHLLFPVTLSFIYILLLAVFGICVQKNYMDRNTLGTCVQICVLFYIPLFITFCLSAARRLRHIGCSPYLTFCNLFLLVLYIFFPTSGIFLGGFFLILLCTVPPLFNMAPQPQVPTYLLINILITVVPIVVVLLLTSIGFAITGV